MFGKTFKLFGKRFETNTMHGNEHEHAIYLTNERSRKVLKWWSNNETENENENENEMVTLQLNFEFSRQYHTPIYVHNNNYVVILIMSVGCPRAVYWDTVGNRTCYLLLLSFPVSFEHSTKHSLYTHTMYYLSLIHI